MEVKVFETESANLFNKIMECRIHYLCLYGVEPHYVVIPWGYIYLLEQCSDYCTGYYECDTVYGLQIIESRACHNFDEVRVY